MEQKGFEVPNHTQTPNTFFDSSLPEIKSLVELKVVLAIIRQTFGWQKMADRISLSQLQRLTGLTRESVSTGIQAALDHGYVERKAVKNGFIYNLKVVRNSDQSGIPTSQEFRPKVVRDSDHLVVGIPDPQKKEEKEKKEKGISRPFCGRPFTDALANFMAHHREIGKPYKPTGLKQLYRDLESWGEEAATEALAASVRNRWQGVFRPKGNGSLFPEHPNAHRPGKMVL